MTTPLKIRVRDLKKSFGEKVVLDGINLDLPAGESFVIIGGSGTGKSVLIKCLLGLVKPDAGSIKVNGQEIVGLSYTAQQEALDKFGMLFQGGALFDSMTVWENVAFALTQGHGMSEVEAKEIAMEKLRAVNLDESTATVYPAELSGGMQKRVALARAIAFNPEVIFFDEPTTGLDPIVSGTINQLIIDSVRRIGASALTITHDMASLRKIADRVGLLYHGKLMWVGTVQEMDATDNPYVVQFIQGLSTGPFTTG
ncbi:MAG: transporter [Alphaproteobacteria bacterium]|jgi:phospholipid/cholesterol/gamma-HCH transport system ATP-binding protein|nr:transporter [Alphaproteobacteria bacterium]